MEIHEIISRNVKKIRVKKGISQRKLSELAKIDVRMISKLENRPEPMSTSTIQKLCIGLNVQVLELLEANKSVLKQDTLPKKMKPGLEEAIRLLRVHLTQIS